MTRFAYKALALVVLLVSASGCGSEPEAPSINVLPSEIATELNGKVIKLDGRDVRVRRNAISGLSIESVNEAPNRMEGEIHVAFSYREQGREYPVKGTLTYERHGLLIWYGSFTAR